MWEWKVVVVVTVVVVDQVQGNEVQRSVEGKGVGMKDMMVGDEVTG